MKYRKQVKAGQVEKKESAQSGKEYSMRVCALQYCANAYMLPQISGTTSGLAVIARTAIPSKILMSLVCLIS